MRPNKSGPLRLIRRFMAPAQRDQSTSGQIQAIPMVDLVELITSAFDLQIPIPLEAGGSA